jgi:hypothetical protein
MAYEFGLCGRDKALKMTLEERVQAGVTWLNRHFPGWKAWIDVMRLNMALGDDCISGQIREQIGDSAWLEAIGPDRYPEAEGTGMYPCDLGMEFTEQDNMDIEYAELQKLWIAELQPQEATNA